ncbi:MAG: 5-oxoprolinase [Phycisphaeraceae bacterium]|nr:5-oxoprolinase [Phycisphaeraceae bacterium]
MSDIDPITLEIMRNRWRGIADEGCAAMVRTAYSPNIKDRFDCSLAIAMPDGQVLAQAETGTPLHLGVMPAVLGSVLARFPVERMRPGDAIITNLPYPEGPGHLPDLSMVSVVHHDGAPVALVATTAHHVDLGGFAPGSMPFGVTEIYQEGLQVPPTLIIREGVMDEAIFGLIHQNVRTGSELHGDLMAQYAAACTAEQRIAELIARQGIESARRSMPAILDHAERCMRAGIDALPDGTYSFEDFMDDDGVVDEPVRIALTLTIRGDELIADFAGTNDQVLGPLNARVTAARACVYYATKAVIDPDLPTCAGAYRPIRVTAPEGCLLHARFPAAIGNANILTDQRVVDVLLGAFHQAAPERVCAACSGEMNLINVGGIDPRTGDYYNYVETYGGGQGAFHDADGQDGIHTHLTNTRNTPVEVIEQTYPLRVVRYALIPDSDGAGRQRGGCGIVRELVCLGERTTASLGADRRKFTPWGVDGGARARGAHCTVMAPDGTVRELPTKVVTTLGEGDHLRIETPGGGGWGDPKSRDREAVERDVAEGLVSRERADSVYG